MRREFQNRSALQPDPIDLAEIVKEGTESVRLRVADVLKVLRKAKGQQPDRITDAGRTALTPEHPTHG